MSNTFTTISKPLSISLANELDWLQKVLAFRGANSAPGEYNSIYDVLPPVPENDFYGELVLKFKFSFDERLVLILALAPHLRPDLLEVFRRNEDKPAIFGGYTGKNHRGFIPTGETALFILAGKDVSKRNELQKLFDIEHFFYTENILSLYEVDSVEPLMSGILTVSRDFICQFVYGKKPSPEFNKNFPAKILNTKMEWSDLVLNSATRQQLNEIETWLEFNHVLMNGWGLSKVIKPGYKALFHGPPGTGKSLTAALLGKRTGRDVYRIDLSMVVSKYIGETEKNLAGIFDRAENKNWILFFDEADALFGKRTSVSSSHDKYANQEVSYLLQRVEDFNGLVILASNLKSNIDDAFSRRFNSIIYYPLPKQEERYHLWKNSFSSSTQLDENVRLEDLAQKYELSGGHIINVVHYCSLMAASRNDNVIRMEDIIVGVRKEFSKLGRTI